MGDSAHIHAADIVTAHGSLSCCRAVKEEEGAAPPKGSNSLSGRELRALMRSNQEKEAGTADTRPGSTKGEPHSDSICNSED